VTTIDAPNGPEPPASKGKNPGLTPLMLNHAAWVTHDVEATAEFYTRIMGMELASTVYDDRVPSTGDEIPYFHIFFRMQDGSTIAFFEAIGIPERLPAPHAAYDVFDHIALETKDRAEVDRWHQWLVSNDIDVVGPTDHKGLIYSIYFHDPNGLRLEITAPLAKDWNKRTSQGYADLKMWCDAKRSAQLENRDVGEALLSLIREKRKRS
jgi:catechol 2,3-dioxygenase-like lactoylglutathione lyase family enzyme